MSTPYVVTLFVLVAAIAVARAVLPVLPARRVTVRLHPVEGALTVLGALGLAAHCAAMFYRSTVQSLPGAAKMVSEIDTLGTASILAFAVPAVLLIVGLRRIYSPALALVVLALAAVGTTMYDKGPLTAHLIAIFLTITLLALCAATLIGQPQTGRRIAAAASFD